MIRRHNIRVCWLFFLLLTTQRLPAPITEESPTPTATPALATTAIPSVTPPQTPGTIQHGAVPSVPPVPGQTMPHFAGKWVGTMNEPKFGPVEITLVINGDATALKQSSKQGAAMRATTRNGNAISWTTGAKNEMVWTMALNPGGQTALVTRKFANHTLTATFQHGAPEETPGRPPDQQERKKHRRRPG